MGCSKTIRIATIIACGWVWSAQGAENSERNGKSRYQGIVEEVVVTAQRRTERLEDVPIAISAASDADLTRAGITSSRDLRFLVPGLNFYQQGSFSQPTIRGVGTSIVGPGADANVAIYLDGVYQPSQNTALFEFNNIEQIQVLKGPQGTLYGRNATGGAIVVTTKAPSFEPSGSLEAGYARFDELTAKAYVTGGLTERLAGSLSVLSRSDDGYSENLVTGHETSEASVFSAQGKLLFDVNDQFSMTLSGFYLEHEDNTAFSYKPTGSNFLLAGTQAATVSDTSKIALSDTPLAEADGHGGSLSITYDMNGATFTSVSGYADYDVPFATDVDATELPIVGVSSPQTQETYTQEFTFAGATSGRWDWLVGASYFKDETKSEGQVTQFGVSGPLLEPQVTTEAYAAYAELTFDIDEDLHLTVGGRYSDEEKDFVGDIGGARLVDTSESWDAFSARLSLRYDLSERARMYASISEGFKSGVFNATSFDPNPVDPEEIISYEIGYKYRSDVLSLSTSVFYYDYEDIQVSAIDNSSGFFVSVQNAATAEIYGLDVDFAIDLSDKFSINAGAAYVHSEYEDFPNANIFLPAPTAGNIQLSGDVSGNEMIQSPEFSAFTTLNYFSAIRAGFIAASLTASYTGEYFFDAANRQAQDDFVMLNARVSWLSPDERFTVSLFGKNLGDEEYIVFLRQSAFGEAASYSRPRTYGVSFEVRF